MKPTKKLKQNVDKINEIGEKYAQKALEYVKKENEQLKKDIKELISKKPIEPSV